MVFVKTGVKINAEYYQTHILNSEVKEHGQVLHPDIKWTFQQDSAPSHKANINKQWCLANLSVVLNGFLLQRISIPLEG